MDSAGFDPTRWNHWLLIGCFISVSIWGLYLSWQWSAEARLKRKRVKSARRLKMELHAMRCSSAANGQWQSPSIAQRARQSQRAASPQELGNLPQNTMVNEEFTASRSINNN